MMDRGAAQNADDPGLARVMTAAAKHDLPVNFLAWGIVERLEPLAARYPDTAMVIDHVGMLQPQAARAGGRLRRFAQGAEARELQQQSRSRFRPAMSRAPFPVPRHLGSGIFDAADERMWGTDWTRTSPLLTYREGVEAFRVTDRLSDSDRATLMGGALTRIYGWSPKR